MHNHLNSILSSVSFVEGLLSRADCISLARVLARLAPFCALSTLSYPKGPTFPQKREI